MMSLGTYVGVLAGYLRPYRLAVVCLGFFLAIDLAFSAAWPLSFKVLIDTVILKNDHRALIILLSVLLGGVLLSSMAAIGRDYVYSYLGSRVLRDIRIRIFTHLQGMSPGFFARHRTGDLMARFTTDLGALEYVLNTAIGSVVLGTVGIMVSGVVLFALEWRLATATVAGLLLCIVLPRPLVRRATRVGYETKGMEGALADQVQESLGAQQVIRAFSLQRRGIQDFESKAHRLATSAMRFNLLNALVERLPTVTILIFEVLIMGVGVLLVFYGHRTLGTIIAFHGVFLNIAGAVQTLTVVTPLVLQSIGGLQRIEELLAQRSQVSEHENAVTSPKFGQAICFDGVCFSYDGEQVHLKDVTLSIPQGTFVAFVGPSGSGKSTILNLMLRFYDPSGGEVKIDGNDLRTVATDSWRSQIGVVFQDNFLFHGTIRDNIRIGRLDASDSEIENAARAAEIHDWIVSQARGYETSVGERGAGLSGGQRQRIAIARALLRAPEILLLDEATSALDPATEAALNATIERIRGSRTLISITHRLSSVSHADCIYVLQQGRLVEHGRHEALEAQSGVYAQLWRRQSGFSIDATRGQAEITTARLKRFPILEEVDEATLEDLKAAFATEIYEADRLVVHEGDPGDRFYVIARGSVSVQKMGADGGTPRQVAVLRDGDYFGEIALLKKVPRTATIRTQTQCTFLSLRNDQFQHFLDRSPTLREKFEQRQRILAGQEGAAAAGATIAVAGAVVTS